MEESNNGVIQFQWGRKRGVGGAKKDVQFYESFIFDEVNYNLYDCVYVFKEGEDIPYIAKIVKIWEQSDAKKKVKLLWFFRPGEILKHLGDQKVLDNEIFLASGEGVGLANINPLEAISAKCSVICTSEDARNLQASKDALERADYIFYRTFDVSTLKISDKFPDKIAGLEVSSLLNRKEDQTVSLPLKPELNGFSTEVKRDASSATHDQENKVKTEEPEHAPLITLPSEVAIYKKHQNDAQHFSDVRGVGEGDESISQNADETTSRKHKAEPDDLRKSKHGKKVCVRSDKGDSGESANQLSEDNSGRTKLSDKKPKPKDQSLQKPVAGPAKNNTRAESQIVEVPRKPLKLNEKKLKSTDELLQKPVVAPAKNNTETESQMVEVPRKPLNEKKLKSTDESLQKPVVAPAKNNTETESQMLEVPRKPDADRSKWFKGITWERRIHKANEQGTLMFLQNFDRSLTSADIEEIMRHFCNQIVTAKVISAFPPYHNPHYGQAYVIFRTPTAADETIKKINTGCLMLKNGSAFIASKGVVESPPKPTKLIGHLTINKIKMQMQREEMRKAVSTSHCSQPNTIEYEMAMDWSLLQERTVNWFNNLHKRHREEVKKVVKSLKDEK